MGRFVRWVVAGVVAAGSSSLFAAQVPIEVTAKRLGANRVQVRGRAVVRHSSDIVWRVLTDYDHLSEFIPGLIESRMTTTGSTRLLMQRGTAGWWVFRRGVRVTFQVTEIPPRAIEFTAVAGDFLEHHGAWRLQPTDGQVEIRYEATVRPAFVLPPFLGERVLRRQLAASLQAIGKRVEAVSARTLSTTP